MATGELLKYKFKTFFIQFFCPNVRFAEVRNTLQGKLEERLPFFSFIFPEAFKKRYSKEYSQFKNNLHRLVTPFDVHETFLDILREFFFSLEMASL